MYYYITRLCRVNLGCLYFRRKCFLNLTLWRWRYGIFITISTNQFNQESLCLDQNIPGYLGQNCNQWFLRSVHGQSIISHVMRRIKTDGFIWEWINDRNWKYIIIFHQNNSARKVLFNFKCLSVLRHGDFGTEGNYVIGKDFHGIYHHVGNQSRYKTIKRPCPILVLINMC